MYPNKKRKEKSERKGFIDIAIYGIAILAPSMTIPQLYAVWMQRDVKGVSLITWMAYAVAAAFWLSYGLVKKDRPIIFANVGLMVIDILIVAGVLLYR